VKGFQQNHVICLDPIALPAGFSPGLEALRCLNPDQRTRAGKKRQKKPQNELACPPRRPTLVENEYGAKAILPKRRQP
jgi:hypothetical protein